MYHLPDSDLFPLSLRRAIKNRRSQANNLWLFGDSHKQKENRHGDVIIVVVAVDGYIEVLQFCVLDW